MRAFIPLTLASLFLVAGNAKSDDAQDEWKKLQGTWKIVSWQQNGGKPMTPPSERWVIKGDQLTSWWNVDPRAKGAAPVATYKLKIDPTRKPKTIDQRFDLKESKGANWTMGIYEVDGDNLKICFSNDGNGNEKNRPGDFTCAKDSGRILYTFKREKK
jgi:uncharacterized protein (TIGR03067 family)